MNKFLFFLLFILCSANTLNAQKPLITHWTINSYNKIEIITSGAFNYKYKKYGSPNESIMYSSPGGVTTINLPNSGGDYVVSLYPVGTNPFRLYPTNLENQSLISKQTFRGISQWGDVNWFSDLSGMFSNCSQGISFSATDSPNFSNVTNMSRLFFWTQIHGDISNWDVSNVTKMSEMFEFSNAPFTGLENWNVSKVADMSDMFYDSNLNLDISNWNVSNVTNMNRMFMNARSFNQSIGNWNVSKVTNMGSMFSGARAFNQNIGNWDVSNVTTMSGMFSVNSSPGSSVFNQDISNWNVSNVTSMSGMFMGATAFNQNIGNWNVSKVTNMDAMFASTLNNTEGLTFNQDISNWDVSKVTSMSRMFSNAKSFNQDISSWNVSNVTKMTQMFSGATVFNQNIGNWNVSKVYSMEWMFSDATAFNQNLGNWKLNNNVSLAFILDKAGFLCQNYALTLKGWAENPSTPTNKNLGATNVKYGTVGKTYRDFLTTQKGWTFSGDIFEPSCNDALSTNENSLSEKLNFYPNPTTGRIFYQSKTDESLQINNTAGQLLKTIKVTKGTNQIDISEFPKGVYFLKAGAKTSKLLKN